MTSIFCSQIIAWWNCRNDAITCSTTRRRRKEGICRTQLGAVEVLAAVNDPLWMTTGWRKSDDSRDYWLEQFDYVVEQCAFVIFKLEFEVIVIPRLWLHVIEKKTAEKNWLNCKTLSKLSRAKNEFWMPLLQTMFKSWSLACIFCGWLWQHLKSNPFIVETDPN